MLSEGLFWLGFIVSAVIGFVYFRDLGDVTQIVIKARRENMIRFIRNEYRLLGLGIAGLILMAVMHIAFGASSPWVFWPAAIVIVVLLGFTWVWVHVGMRN